MKGVGLWREGFKEKYSLQCDCQCLMFNKKYLVQCLILALGHHTDVDIFAFVCQGRDYVTVTEAEAAVWPLFIDRSL